MTLIDAIKSGKRFRRPYHKTWIEPRNVRKDEADVLMTHSESGKPGLSYLDYYRASATDIVADDWIIESPAVTITKEQFWEAFETTVEDEGNYINTNDLLRRMADKLGLA